MSATTLGPTERCDRSDGAVAALIAAASDGREIVDDACAKKAVAELTRE